MTFFSFQIPCFVCIAVDDIEEGKGADEELCLLPDEEREISDADRERAMQNQQQAADENDDNENEQEESDGIDVNMEAIEENGKKLNCQIFRSLFYFNHFV